MRDYEARKLSEYHKFTRKELHDILKKALDELPQSFWGKPCRINGIFDNGYHFNMCRNWVDYNGHNGDSVPGGMIAYRVLQIFGKFSPIQLSVKNKPNIQIKISQVPTLTPSKQKVK